MTLRDKELEDRIEEVGNKLTTPPSDVQQLLQLLDKAENFLSRVEQCPPQSMHVALNPSMKALVTRDLLRHSDLDVKIAVASCLSEITRITAPDAPYDDDLMKEIFALIVGAFKNLDEMSSRSFSKRVSILETVAKVRSCVLMLDLECDDLILDMFHHFLKTIRPKHSDTVFTSMETVMSLVIEESENISAKLLSCLLDNLKIDEKNIMSSAKKLAEKVLANCAVKLNPYLVDAFKGSCAPLSDYSKIVAAVCQGNLGTLMQNEINSLGETQADDSKLSDRTLCDELPQGSAKQVHEVLGKSVADADGSSKLLMSNGAFQMGNGDSTASEQKAQFSQSDVQLRDIDGSRLGDSDNLGSGATKLDSGLNLSSRKGRKRKALVKLANDHKQIDGEKEAPAITGRRKGRSKDADLSQVDGFSFKEVETAACSKPKKKNKLEPTSGLADVSSPVFLHSPNEHDEIHSRKGRASRSKKTSGKRKATDKAAVDGSASASGHGGLLESSQTNSGDFPTKELSSKKTDVISESERNLSKYSASKSHAYVEDSKTTPTVVTCDSETKLQRHRGRSGSQREVKEVDFSVEKQSTGTKRQKGGGLHVDEEDKEVKLKELVSSRKSTLKESIEDQSLLKDISESKSRRKHARGAEAVTIGTPKRRKSNEKLIGEKIRVWWPDDERFYDGVVDSFDRSTKKHKILYDDGDVEVLLLKNEKWEFIEAESKTGGVQENNTSDINASDIRNKKSKGRRGDAALDKSKSDLVMNSPDSTIKTESNVKISKRKRRPSVEALADETPKKSGKGRGKSTNRDPAKRHKHNNRLTETANKSDSEKLAQSIKPDLSKSVDKVGIDKSNDSMKIRRKLKGDSSRSSVKPKNVSPKSRKKSRDAHDSGVKSKDEDSPRTKSSTEGRRRKPGGRLAKGSSQKAQGSSAPRISRNLNANDAQKSDQPKGEEAEARSTSGKKRKRARHGR